MLSKFARGDCPSDSYIFLPKNCIPMSANMNMQSKHSRPRYATEFKDCFMTSRIPARPFQDLASLNIRKSRNARKAITPEPVSPYRLLSIIPTVTNMPSNILDLSDMYPRNPRPINFNIISNKNRNVSTVFAISITSV